MGDETVVKKPTLLDILEQTLGAERVRGIEESPYNRIEQIEKFYLDYRLKLAAQSQAEPTEELIEHLKQKYCVAQPYGSASAAIQMHRMNRWPEENLLTYVKFAVSICDESHYDEMDNQWTFPTLQHAFYVLQKNYNLTVDQVWEKASRIRGSPETLARRPQLQTKA